MVFAPPDDYFRRSPETSLMKCLSFALLLISLCLGLPAPAAESSAVTDLDQAVAAAVNYQSGQSLEPFRYLEAAVRKALAQPAARKEVEAALIKLLGSESTFEARRFACKQLGFIGGKDALPFLAGLLKEEETVGIACLALTTYPRGQADAMLRAELTWAQGPMLVQVINTLGDRHDEGAVTALARLVTSSDQAVSEAAIAALGKIGNGPAWRTISQLRKHADPALEPVLTDATLRCAEKLAASGDRKAASAVYDELLTRSSLVGVRRSALSALLRLDLDGGEERIARILSGEDAALKPVAIAAVAGLPSHGASARFAAALHHLQPQEQVLMIDSLAARNDADARLVLAKSVSSTQLSTRVAAINALGRLGDPYFAGLLARAAALAEGDESRAIETALVGLHGGAQTDKVLAAELKTASSKARVVLMGALARRQGAAATPLLLEQAASSDNSVAKCAFRTLARTATPADAPAVITRLAAVQDAGVRSEGQSTASQLLTKVPNASSRSAMVRQALATATNAEPRCSLLGLLPACGDAAALTVLTLAVSDSEDSVREAALRALADWPDGSVWDTLLALYRKPETEAARGIALRGLVRIVEEQNANPDAALFEHYRQLLAGARTDADLKLILGSLSGASHPDALVIATGLLLSPGVRPEASVAVRRIAESIKGQYPEAAQQALQRLPK